MWKLEVLNHRRYARNAIATVLAQLRYHPLLLMSDRISDIHELLRGEYPEFEVVQEESFEFQPPDDFKRSLEEKFRISTVDGDISIVFGTEAVLVESKNHRDRSNLLKAMTRSKNALCKIFSDVKPTRIGIKYVNIISKTEISDELNEEIRWNQLIDKSFLCFPKHLLEYDEDTKFIFQLASALPPGILAAKYGIFFLPDEEPLLRLDIDRFDKDFDELERIEEVLTSFADDIFSFFNAAAGPKLMQWMQSSEESES